MKPKIALGSCQGANDNHRIKTNDQFSDRTKLLFPPPKISTFYCEWNQSSACLLPASSWKPTPQLPECCIEEICWVATDGSTNVHPLLLVFKQSHDGSNSIAMFSSALNRRICGC